MPALVNNFAAALLTQRRLVLVLVICLVALSGWHASREFRINSDLGTLIKPSGSLLWYRQNEEFKRQFPMFEQTALVVLSSEQAISAQRAASSLAAQLRADDLFSEVFAPTADGFVAERRAYFLSLDELSDWLQGVEYSYGSMLRLADEANLTSLSFVLGDHLSSNRGLPLPAPLETLVTGIAMGNANMAAIPLLVDPDVKVHHEIIIVRGEQNLDQQMPNEQLVARLRGHIEKLGVAANVRVRLTGEIPLAHEEISAALNGIEIAGAISVVLLGLILGFGIRSLGFVLAIFALLAAGVTLTLGLAVSFVGAFNTLSLIFVIMFFGLGVDFAVHFGLRIREAMQDQAYSAAFIEALADVGPALVLCMVTSSVAFLSFYPTAYIGLGELGLISAIGMAVALILTLVFLPVLLSFTEAKSKSVEHNGVEHNGVELREPSPLIRRLITQVSEATPKTVVLSFCLIVLASGWLAKELEFDYSVLAMRDANTEGMQALLELQDSGVTTDYSIAVIAEDLTHAQALKVKLEGLDVVGNVLGPDQLLPSNQAVKQQRMSALKARFSEIEKVFGGEDHDPELFESALQYLSRSLQYATPEVRTQIESFQSATQALTSVEVSALNSVLGKEVERSLFDAIRTLGAPTFVMEDVPVSLYGRFVTEEHKPLLRVQPNSDLSNRAATTHFIEQVAAVAPNIAGRSVVEWGVGNVVVESFLEASAFAFIAIFLILAIFFRGLVLPILVLTPVVVSLLMTFAICQVTGLTLNMANILVVPLIIGLGVDTGIHVVHRTLGGIGAVGTENLFHSSTSRAVVISALTTIGTFFSLSFSPHLGAASIGLLLTVAISLLVVVTFVLLPALIRLLGLDKQN